MKVPAVLISGNHADILKWRAEKSLVHTRRYRPDLLPFEALDEDLKHNVYEATATAKGRSLKLLVALMHYPMKDKQGMLVATSVTNIDLHDISRTSATYGVGKYYVVTPLKSQQEIAGRVINHWMKGYGATYNSNRKQAFSQTVLCDSILFVIKDIEEQYGEKPIMVATTARENIATISAKSLGDLAEKKPVLILFGTGWGFVPAVFDVVDYVLEPITGVGEFNHLSVRSAAAILLDRVTRIN
jgi:tRNA (guanine37-N1)-methyltransferase